MVEVVVVHLLMEVVHLLMVAEEEGWMTELEDYQALDQAEA